jgi:hypothetical protein
MVALAAAGGGAAEGLGQQLVDVPAGEFRMGRADESFRRDLCFTELPAHSVRITYPFRIAATEVTLEQYRRFRPDFVGTTDSAPYATGMSWHDAVAFCEWLGKVEGRPYRLPTEAEWEYAAQQAEALGLQGMLSGPLEWCQDWFGDYPDQAQTDPVGPDTGLARAVRGGCLDEPGGGMVQIVRFDAAHYAHVSHRAGIAPAFGADAGAPVGHGQHRIGFRVVQAPRPATAPWPATVSFAQLGIKDTAEPAQAGPDPARPYLRKRHLLPVPPDNRDAPAHDAAGLHPSFRGHNHCPALTVCPNGDVLMAIYTSYHEYEPEVSLIAARLRVGADEWDMPAPWVDFPGANDHAPLLYSEGGTVWLFWGNPLLPGAFPFQWIESRDSGATWGEVRFPRFLEVPGTHSRQPINSAFRGPGGVLYVASDGNGSQSVLWASRDDGRTWRDSGGRSAGRHTTYCLLKDGSILGMGGKNSHLDGFMPGVVSRDGGTTWETFKTEFPALASNQRPTLLRLRSGRLFFAGDFQDINGKQPPGVTRLGSYVALSEDDGKTWHTRKLVGTQAHENGTALGGADTLGYAAACQAPNGMIHLITSMNHPCLHFELNEAWILAPEAADPGDAALMTPAATQVVAPREYRETSPAGRPRIVWSGGLADDGRFLLHGKETRFYADGRTQYEATYHLGRKVGAETQWRPEGALEWQWQHPAAGTPADAVSVWTQYWPNGARKAESRWRGRFADGLATGWNAQGKEVSRARFVAGKAMIELAHEEMGSHVVSRGESGGAKAGALCYRDRAYAIVSLPPEVAGGDLVRTANDDDYSTRSDHLTLELPAASTVYVCYWAEAHDLPGWLRQDSWRRVDSQARVRIGDQDKAYTVYRCAAAPGRLSLGGNERERTGAAGMYFVVTRPGWEAAGPLVAPGGAEAAR